MNLRPSQSSSPPINSPRQFASGLPFYPLALSLPQYLNIQQFINEWIQQIFIRNGKIEGQTRIRIAGSISKFKLFQLSSCSSVYQLIRLRIEMISSLLRSFIEMSFGMLDKQKRHLCKMLQNSKDSLQKNQNLKIQVDQLTLAALHPPVAKMIVLFYKYVCGAIKQICNLWNLIYQYIQVKDLEISTFQKSISTFVLNIFTASNKAFNPLCIFPSMSQINKYKFICADSQGVSKRLDLCKFNEEELKKVLIEKKIARKHTFGIIPQQFTDQQRQILEEIKKHFSQDKKTKKGYQKPKIDIPFIQELKNQVIRSQSLEKTEAKAFKYQVFCEDSLNYNEKNSELSTTFQAKSGLVYEIDDTSSQEDITAFYENEQIQKDELILQSQDILLEYLQAKVHKEIKEADGSTKLSSSTANEEHTENCQTKSFDFVLSSDLYIPEGCTEEYLKEYPDVFYIKRTQKLEQVSQNKEKEEIKDQENQEYHKVEKVNQANNFQFHSSCLKNEKILRTEKSKRYLEEEKQKLEKYRKELEKEKEQLLKEVERFMKEKEKDQCYFKQATSHFNTRANNHFKANCDCIQSLKKFSFGSTKNYSQDFHLNCNQAELLKNREKQEQWYEGRHKQISVEEAIDKEIFKSMYKEEEYQLGETSNTNQQMNSSSKKRQKNRKKQEKQLKKNAKQIISTSTNSSKLPQLIGEDEAQLVKVMQSLKINESLRANCHIQESRLEKWKDRIFKIRNSELPINKTSKAVKESLGKDQNKQEKPKKKQKR